MLNLIQHLGDNVWRGICHFSGVMEILNLVQDDEHLDDKLKLFPETSRKKHNHGVKFQTT